MSVLGWGLLALGGGEEEEEEEQQQQPGGLILGAGMESMLRGAE